jgi:biotin carboxyl carrier protein
MGAVRREFERDGQAVRVSCEPSGAERYVVRIGEASHEVEAHRTPDGQVSFQFGGRTIVAAVAPAGGKGDLHVRFEGRTWRVRPHLGRRAGGAATGGGLLEAPMTGTVLAVHVAVGDVVQQGRTLAVVTAMKMEHKIVADVDGTVAEVAVAAGQTVDQGAVLVRIEPAPQAGS